MSDGVGDGDLRDGDGDVRDCDGLLRCDENMVMTLTAWDGCAGGGGADDGKVVGGGAVVGGWVGAVTGWDGCAGGGGADDVEVVGGGAVAGGRRAMLEVVSLCLMCGARNCKMGVNAQGLQLDAPAPLEEKRKKKKRSLFTQGLD